MQTETLSAQTAETFPKTIGERVVNFKTKCATAAKLQVELTNDAREIGLLASEWCRHPQMTLGFFENHRNELPKEASFKLLLGCMSIARRMPEAAKKIEDTRRVWQPTFQSAGLLQVPERDPQNKSSLTPFADFVNRLGDVREVLVRWNRDAPYESWDEETRGSVKAQLKPLVELYETL